MSLHCASFLPAVNSACWAPPRLRPHPGLRSSSDGAISLLTYTGLGQWEVKKINNAHTVSPHPACVLSSVTSALPSLGEGQERHYRVCATGGLLSRHLLGRSEALCAEARQRLHPGRPAAPALFSPGGAGNWFLQVREGQGTGRVAAVACLSATLAVHSQLTWPAVTTGAPGTDWCYKSIIGSSLLPV